MKKIITLAIIAISILFAGCGDDFLSTKNLYQKDLGTYYKNPNDVAEALTGAYSCLAIDEGGNHPILISNIMGDDCYSGGGTNDIQTIGTDKFDNPVEDLYLSIYSRCYAGIFRINSLLAQIDNAVYTDDAAKKQDKGEAYFLRALFYFRLAQIFGEVPLKLNISLEYLPKSTAPDIYAQITTDLSAAIDNMTAVPYSSIPKARLGHATKWAAEALMARVFLFYTGYYQQTSLPLKAGGTVEKTQVITWLEDCIANSGHGLLTDFRGIWPWSYLGDTHADGYAYANGVNWVTDGGKENVFSVKYSPFGDWGNTGRLAYSNQYVLFTSVRAKDYPPFGAGWGIGDVSPQLKAAFEPGDIRRTSTIIDNTDPQEGVITSGYSWGGWNCANETGLWNKKYTSIIQDLNGNGTYTGMFYNIYGGTNNMQLWNMQDDILIRFADVLLMAAELGSHSQQYLDLVRGRVGLTAVPYTLAALKHERQVELALEGLRYYDLLRWGDAATAINAANGTPIKTDNVSTTYSVTFNPARAFVKLPESQVRVSQGKLIQNPGWE